MSRGIFSPSAPPVRHGKEKGPRFSPKPLILLVGRVGFEPTTDGLRVLLIQQPTTNNSKIINILGGSTCCRFLWITALCFA